MKAQLNDIKAAILLLTYFQIQQQDEPDLKILKDIRTTLTKIGYITMDDSLIYDNEGIPQNIPWQNPKFDCQAIYTHIGYDPYWFTT